MSTARIYYNQHSNNRYGDAQKFLDDPTLKGDVANSVRLLHGVAQKLRAKRIRAGALQLASPEVRFQIDSETHDPIAVEMYVIFFYVL